MKNPLSTKKSVTVLLGAASVASLYVLRKSKEKRTRRAKIVCHCGKVEAELYIPAANYRYLEPACFQCGCNDCVNFVDKCLDSGAGKTNKDDFCTPGAPYIIMYDSEISVTRGQNLVKSMKLSEKTPNRRVYSKCCATPLGVSLDSMGTNLVYPPNITETNLQPDDIAFPPESLEPQMCLFSNNTRPEKKVFPEDLLLISSAFAPKFIGLYISRLVILLGLGAKGPGKGFPTTGELDIGIDSIKSEERSSE